MAEAIEKPMSFNRSLATIHVGETVAISRYIPRTDPAIAKIGAVKEQMRRSAAPAVSRARKAFEQEFVLNSGSFQTDDGHVIVTVAVTRLS